MANILIIDDDQGICDLLSRMVGRMGYDAAHCLTLKDGLTEASSKAFDVIFLDVNLPDGNGLEALAEIRKMPYSPEVIVMTGLGDADGAEAAIRNGAWDYLQKPISAQAATLPIKRVLQYRDALKKDQKPPVALKLNGIIGTSPPMRDCFDLVAQAADSHASVLITGETGTGKELFARAIHRNSPRSKKSFVVVDCAAMPETLVESALFGYEKGAFTGADKARQGLICQADGGVLFLDEVGELPLTIQKAFLRVLQERRFRPVGGNNEIESDFRLISATNRDLDQLVRAGQFREDLLYRLRSITINLPPLRQRTKDIKALVSHYVAKLCETYGTATKGISPDFLDFLSTYNWPGNVRELINALDRTLAATQHEEMLFPKDLPERIRIKVARGSVIQDDRTRAEGSVAQGPVASAAYPKYRDFRDAALAEAEKRYFQDLMSLTRGSIKEACRVSGLGRTRLYTLMKKHSISRTGWSPSNTPS
ncbi:MAG: sigma-54 dependent transcriptional regulator [Thermodesulfobacteriota bacterium]|nr:sigma-54 dependent transcriptional regulator [Thermodesulfobacteriota bacterium]